MKVQNMTSTRSGREVPNQFILWDDAGSVYFQSYNSLIAKWDGERLTLGRDFDYSVTTSKYLHLWIDKFCSYSLRESIEECFGSGYSKKLQNMIDNGHIDYNGNMR